MLQAFDE
jgi:anti-sigma B factor antagonist